MWVPTAAPTDVDLSDNRQPELYAAATIPFVFALVCVSLRFWCRRINRAALGLDDWLILFALCCSAGMSGDLLIWWIPRALGKHVFAFGPDVGRDFAIGLLAAEMCYIAIIAVVKLSIMSLYWRIFNRTQSIKIPIYVLSLMVSLWGLALMIVPLVQCMPLRALWDKSLHVSCKVDPEKYLYALGFPNVAFDFALLILPIPYVIKLNISGAQKKAIMCMFILGTFVVAASVMRLVTVLTEVISDDVPWNLVGQTVWAIIEADLAIVSTCLPTLRPLWQAIRPSVNSATPLSGNGTYRNRHQGGRPFPNRRNHGVNPMSITSILRTNASQETLATSENNAHHAVSIPLKCSVRAAAVRSPTDEEGDEDRGDRRHADVIRVENTWDVEFAHVWEAGQMLPMINRLKPWESPRASLPRH